MKTCPYCAESIQDEAIKCRYCGERLDRPPSPTNEELVRSVARGVSSGVSRTVAGFAEGALIVLIPVAIVMLIFAVIIFIGVGGPSDQPLPTTVTINPPPCRSWDINC